MNMSSVKELFIKETPYYLETSEDGAEDIWDDRKLNDAYDKALKMANAEVAKRVAMSTNSHPKNKKPEGTSQGVSKTGKSKSSKSNKKSENIVWKASMPCRAIYEGDGQEYEAIVLRVINENECVVKFLGYGDSEIVALNSLRQSFGREEQNRQIEEAFDDKSDGASTSQSPNMEKMDCASDRVPSPTSTDRLSYKVKKTSKKKKQSQSRSSNGFDLPQMPFAMPSMSALRNFGSIDMPLPPPPPLALSGDRHDSEDQAISSMLLSWYMSGYYTGLYQGLKRSKENRRHM